ncbi:Lysophospholipase L1 [Goodfellowiella coeruleoviolacea]|uniref:Lysophospholipase L1 n=2 Tax=Goodfellowiella coeruleoviolacea TaxID=334858 RepID=A0AAE3GEJ6_9PSEU|nr:Lysophospholipase L1 [Goodfellowiella coeruleoviolacea]
MLVMTALVLAATAAGCVSTADAGAPGQPNGDAAATNWTAAWGSAMQFPIPLDQTPASAWSQQGFADHTLRQTIRLSTGGSSVRVHLSNQYGTQPLKVAGAAIARTGDGAVVWPDSQQRLAFAGSASVVIPPGQEVVSDAVKLTTAPLERLSVTTHFAEPTGPTTFHRSATATSYRAAGDHLTDPAADAFTETADSWFYLSGVDVAGGASRARSTVVLFGDSLVDGVGSTVNSDSRLSDDLAERLVAAQQPLSVVNTGIGGNKLLSDATCGGEKALARFERDVLDRPGVRTVLVHLGGNDIGTPQMDDGCIRPNPRVTGQQLIEGYQELVRAAHARGVKIIGATILPLKGAKFPFWDENAERTREEVNTWIRTSGAFDAVVDIAQVLANPTDPAAPRPGYVFVDGLHPNDTGYHAIAAAIDLTTL